MYEDDWDQKPEGDEEVVGLGYQVYTAGAEKAFQALIAYIDANPRTVADIRAFCETGLRAIQGGEDSAAV